MIHLAPGASVWATHAEGAWIAEDGTVTSLRGRVHNPTTEAFQVTLALAGGQCAEVYTTESCAPAWSPSGPPVQPGNVEGTLGVAGVHTYPIEVGTTGSIALLPQGAAGAEVYGYDTPAMTVYNRGIRWVGHDRVPLFPADDTTVTLELTSTELHACGPYRLEVR